MRPLSELIRPNIYALLKEGQEDAVPTDTQNIRVHLEANENPFNAPLNRYPDASQMKWREVAGRVKGGLKPTCVSLANGTADAVELLLRTFCVPQRDNILTISPTTPLFQRRARIHDVDCRSLPLDDTFTFTADALMERSNSRTKLALLCSPNTPTGNVLPRKEILRLCDLFGGLVVVDESFVEFSRQPSLVEALPQHPNLVITDSLSVTYALAGIRLAMIYAYPEVIRAIETVRPVHNISLPALREIEQLPQHRFEADKWKKQLLEERRKLILAIRELPFCEKVYPSDANFFLARFRQVGRVYQYLSDHGIAVCDCNHLPGCTGCLRITVGLPGENNLLVGALRCYSEQ